MAPEARTQGLIPNGGIAMSVLSKRLLTSLIAVSALLPALAGAALQPACAGESIAFWDSQRKGANYFNAKAEEQWFIDAKSLGLGWVRMTYDKWRGQGRDFLIGNADRYTGLVPADLATLRQALDWAAKHGIRVVIAPLSLPGARWSQNNGDKHDLRLWQDKAYWEQSARFWGDLAAALKDHPAIAAYNLLNEPTPEMGSDLAEHAGPGRHAAWYRKQQGTARDLPAFYQQVIAAIRKVDARTPIMLDSGWYAHPAAFSYWPRFDDQSLLYAFHMYEPYEFTNHRNFKSDQPYTYPGRVPYGDKILDWGPEQLENHISPFLSWAVWNKVPASRLVASEFGCYRRNPGCQTYLSDLTSIFNHDQLHWAFYSFREDEWDGYDYELGSGLLPPGYWEAREAGKPIPRFANPLFEVLRREFKQP